LREMIRMNKCSNRTALHYIAEEGSVEMLKHLLERCPTGISVTGVDCHGFTPLHLAVRRGHTGVVELLLHVPSMDANVGATVTACNPSGLKPWESYHLMLYKLGIVKALCFADPAKRLRATEECSDGQTPIQIATEANMKETEKVLLERPEVKDFVDRLYRDRQVFVDAANALLVGAALIATVTFAGWLQPPLGYIPDYEFSQPFTAPPQTPESYAAVKNHANVKAFWVFNSLSFFFAIATVL
ncbi:unnamed protein product, partial [Sphagnum compactum]